MFCEMFYQESSPISPLLYFGELLGRFKIYIYICFGVLCPHQELQFKSNIFFSNISVLSGSRILEQYPESEHSKNL